MSETVSPAYKAAMQREADENNPFFAGRYDGKASFYMDAPSRLERVKTMNAARLSQVIAMQGAQKAVRAAAERRLRKLQAGKS